VSCARRIGKKKGPGGGRFYPGGEGGAPGKETKRRTSLQPRSGPKARRGCETSPGDLVGSFMGGCGSSRLGEPGERRSEDWDGAPGTPRETWVGDWMLEGAFLGGGSTLREGGVREGLSFVGREREETNRTEAF